MNSVIRIRLALTEDWPTIKPYDEKAWAMLHDYAGPVEWSLELIESLHARWVMLLQSLLEDQWQCGFKHPQMGPMTIETATLLYACLLYTSFSLATFCPISPANAEVFLRLKSASSPWPTASCSSLSLIHI